MAVLSGCANRVMAPATPLVSTPSTTPEDCIFSLVISDWTQLDRERLILYGPDSRQAFLVKLSFASPDLPFSTGIGVQDGDGNGRICGWGFDAILIPAGVPERIPIASVQKLTKGEADALVGQARPPRKVKSTSASPAAAP